MARDVTVALAGLEAPQLDAAARALIAARARLVHFKAGHVVFAPGDACENYFILVAGSVRVAVTTPGGREILLYRVGPNESCVLTTACLFGRAGYDAEGRTESDVEAIVLPRGALDSLLAESAAFRGFVFSAFGERLHGLIALVQEIAVRHVDKRLARHLVAHAQDGVLDTTHQALATELGTAREVITRLINHFADKGWLVPERGRISLTQPVALERYADAV